MPHPNGDDALSDPTAEPRFDIAVSFAGEDRSFVEAITTRLEQADVRVFYDRQFQAEMWGEDLIEYFDAVYRLHSRFAILFVSRAYAEKMWTRHERRSALARGLEQTAPYVLPVRLDDTDLDGLRPTVGYLDARQVGVDGIVDAVLAKLGTAAPAKPTPLTRVPRTEVERQQLLIDRPPAWEYCYFASELLRNLELAEDKYRDFDVGYAERTGQVITLAASWRYLSARTREPVALNDTLLRLMAPEVQARAFGAPGVEGDRDRILHLAQRINSVYVGWLDWAGSLRGMQMPDELTTLVQVLSRYVELPVERYRAFVKEIVTEADAALPAVARGELVHLTTILTLEILPETTQAFDEELRRVQQQLGVHPDAS